MKLAVLLLTLGLAGQGAGNHSVGVEFNGRQVPLVGHRDAGRVNWTVATQDWGGHPPTTSARTPGEPRPTGWYSIAVNGEPAVVKGYVDGSGRLVWRWEEQSGGQRPNPALMSAFDPRANGVDVGGLVARGVQSNDAGSKAEVEALIAEAAPERVPLPDVVGLGVNWPKLATYAFVGLAALTALGTAFLATLIFLIRLLRRPRR